MIVLTDAGAVQILRQYFKKEAPAVSQNLKIKLFVNDIHPADNHTAADFTEASGGGYGAKTLTAANWNVSVVGGVAQAAYPQQTFGFTGALDAGATVYGYYIVDGDTTPVVIYAERAAVPFVPANNGDALLIDPVFQLSKGVPA